jgi:transcriptional regulator with XRE-family HTH domain
MNEVVAANIRTHREKKAWTQEHLAGAADVTVRTVQRAESGQGMTVETLMPSFST